MKVILFNKNIASFKEKLHDYDFSYETDYETLKKNIKDYDGLIAFGLKQDIDLSGLKWIQSLGAGVDWATSNKTINKDVILTRVTEDLNQELFEYTLSKILAYYQNIFTHYQNQQTNTWNRKLSTTIVDKNVLIVGTGIIGSYIGKQLNNLKMNVYGINSSGYQIEGFKECFTFDTIKENSKYDVVVNVLPSTDKTIDVFNKEFFNKIKMDVFINVGRGTAVKVEDLKDELEKKQIKMAFIDVFKEEPLRKESNLWNVPNLIITPHIAAFLNADKLAKTIISNYEKIISNGKVDKVDIIKGY